MSLSDPNEFDRFWDDIGRPSLRGIKVSSMVNVEIIRSNNWKTVTYVTDFKKMTTSNRTEFHSRCKEECLRRRHRILIEPLFRPNLDENEKTNVTTDQKDESHVGANPHQ
jgi:hypothetical protein